jgi:hypothetical protein
MVLVQSVLEAWLFEALCAMAEYGSNQASRGISPVAETLWQLKLKYRSFCFNYLSRYRPFVDIDA